MKPLANHIIPTREEIRNRFERRLGRISGLFDPLTSLYAEETEMLIMELWRKNTHILEKEEPFVYVNRTSYRTGARHYCPNCRSQTIYPKHNYCPSCGVKIQWTK
jgi:hypothetical protein